MARKQQPAPELEEEEEVAKKYQPLSEQPLNDQSQRLVFLNQPMKNTYCSNVVVTSKYTILDFLPKFLYESFKKLANAYFLLVSILQCVPSISNTGGLPTNAPVLVFILSVDALLAIIEDRRRHIADEEANSATCHRLNNQTATFEDISWSDLKVGEIVELRNRETAPADLLILSVSRNSSAEENSGICYVETKSLDGETNLKLRTAMESTMLCEKVQELQALTGCVDCEFPNNAIGRFNASLALEDGNKEAVDIKNVLLRGCQLRNTEYIYGLVLNTGPETKIMQSSTETRVKWSAINNIVNKMILGLFFFLLFCCCVATTVQVIWIDSNATEFTYLVWENPKAHLENWFLGFGYYFLLMYQIIPVSLYVSISMVMFFQSLFMTWDLDMYHEETDTKMIVRTMGLNDDLGQISYVFSDKTGTLTCNIMEFRKCCINGVSYGTGLTEIGLAALKRANKPIPVFEKKKNIEGNSQYPLPDSVPYVNFDDDSLWQDLSKQNSVQRQKIRDFFMHLAVCHTVIPEKVEGSDRINLSASSPDEQALVAGAGFFGFSFESRGLGCARVRVTDYGLPNAGENKPLLEYQILEVLEFTSARKRMSCIVSDCDPTKTDECHIQLFCKGADNVIFPRLDKNSTDPEILEVTEAELLKFADDGLRTLTIGSKSIPIGVYKEWSKRFKAANADLNEIQKKRDNLPNQIDALMDELETGLTLLGATAIEDKLQKGVPEAIFNLGKAKIKIWMLTGDKQETAINIAYACQLLSNDVEQLVFNMDDYATIDLVEKELEFRKQSLGSTNNPISIIVDGEVLELILMDEKLAQVFVEVAIHCVAVICCRVSPSQKAEVVKLVKDRDTTAVTLSIGDGANDVAMIQQAHIGVGISGQEGMQAVNSSDYAIAQFRYLEKLLLHHGRLNYMRMSILVGYMFYKNIVMVLAQYYYTYLAGSSGQKFYNELGFQLYNVAFTSLPIIYLGVLDYDVTAKTSLNNPILYQKGPRKELFNLWIFLKWMASAIYESLVIFVFTTYAYNNRHSAVGNGGTTQYGLVAFTLVVIICNLKICLFQKAWTWYAVGLWFVGIIGWMPLCVVVSSYWYDLFSVDFGSMQNTMGDFTFWLILPVAVFVALGRHLTWTIFQRMTHPELWQIIQEQEVLGLLPDTEEPPLMDNIEINIGENCTNANNNETMDSYYGNYVSPARSNHSTKSTMQRRRSGFAFSCDPATTIAESYMSTHSVSTSKSAMSDAENRRERSTSKNSEFSPSTTNSPKKGLFL